ncbi:3-deoxy-D-manno-octulosonic acid transferase [Roseivivax lentus]|nr:glycosyltransferase N-terminal domain-containing protein [Roseivivax lentus]
MPVRIAGQAERGASAMARRPLALSAYLAMSRAPETRDRRPDWPERPRGWLLWLHAQTAADMAALWALAQRTLQQHPDLSILWTGHTPEAARHSAALPEDSLPAAAAFLAHWQPNLMIWTGHELRPALLEAAHEAQLPCLMINADEAAFTTPAPRWMPDTTPAALSRFDTIFCVSREAERKLRRQGVTEAQLVRAATLGAGAPPLDCPPELHEDVAAAVGGRPIWLAARLPSVEMRTIFDAHVAAGRLAPRLLLVVVPATSADADAAWAAADETDLRTCFWDAGDMPDDLTQVILCESPAELGLWYRVAPLAYLGGSLAAGQGDTDPLEAAALGSAILYGPNVGRHLATYSRLVEAGAARIVRDADSLGSAVLQVIAPDRAAAMAHAGWEVVTASAETEDRVIARISDLLDRRSARKEVR